MRRLLCLRIVLACLPTISFAQTITQNFGSGANAFTMDFVTIGNPGNVADTTGSPNPAGSVAYIYNIGKYEVSRDQIAKANLAGSLGITMFDSISWGGDGVSKPASGVNWYEAAKFVNYLNISTGNSSAYKFDGGGKFQLWSSADAGYDVNNEYRNSLAKYVLPSSAEWYKAAYGSPSGTWYNYPTGSDTAPIAVAGGTDPNTSVYNQSGPADITNAGGLSAYGTMGQGGNMWEWTESARDGSNDLGGEFREIRGGMWDWGGQVGAQLSTQLSSGGSPDIEWWSDGFRVAMIPEPSSFSLLVLGGLVVALGRKIG